MRKQVRRSIITLITFWAGWLVAKMSPQTWHEGFVTLAVVGLMAFMAGMLEED